jgi:catechol 2,3-dioxygenase-like lactoylglutathione lyase family enzyme
MPTIKVHDLAYVRVRVPDLSQAERFLTDFGLRRAARTDDALYMCGAAPTHHVHITEQGDPNFLSMAFSVELEVDLEAAATIPGASDVEDIAEPGGGKRVWLEDPDGNSVEIVWGIEPAEPIPHDVLPLNDASDGLRRAGTLVRLAKGPSRALRIGHCVLMSPTPAVLVAWYQEQLGLLMSDEVAGPEGDGLLNFMRLDRGDEYVDHHVALIQGGPASGMNHTSFEIHGIDDLMIGREHLMRQGYDPVWGVGRHVYGAQIFDYWMDPWNMMYEHWTDTDRVNASFEGVRRAELETANGPWGMDVPERFFTNATPSANSRHRRGAMST